MTFQYTYNGSYGGAYSGSLSPKLPPLPPPPTTITYTGQPYFDLYQGGLVTPQTTIDLPPPPPPPSYIGAPISSDVQQDIQNAFLQPTPQPPPPPSPEGVSTPLGIQQAIPNAFLPPPLIGGSLSDFIRNNSPPQPEMNLQPQVNTSIGIPPPPPPSPVYVPLDASKGPSIAPVSFIDMYKRQIIGASILLAIVFVFK